MTQRLYYVVVDAQEPVQLESRVNARLEAGFELHGPPVVAPATEVNRRILMQAMTYAVPEEEEEDDG